MSDLKHQSVEQLRESRMQCQSYMSRLSSSLAGQQERLKWIDHYLFEKTPQELTIEQIQQRLGHAVIIKASNHAN